MDTGAHVADASEHPADVSALKVASLDIDNAQGVCGIRGTYSETCCGNCRRRCEARGTIGLGGIDRRKGRMCVCVFLLWFWSGSSICHSLCIRTVNVAYTTLSLPPPPSTLNSWTDMLIVSLLDVGTYNCTHGTPYPVRSLLLQPRRRCGRRSSPSCFIFSELDSRSSYT